MGFLNDQTVEQLEEKNEKLSQQISIEEKKALIAEAKKRYGKDWSKFFNFQSGMDWNALKFKLEN